MPGGDGTGPLGMGSMTGRAAGYCAGYSMPGYANPIAGRGGFGYGRGFGRGWGRGFGRGRGWLGTVYPYAYGVTSAAYLSTPQQEADMLKNQAKAMQEEIDAINNRISELGSAEKKAE